jgi:hypothetical protein
MTTKEEMKQILSDMQTDPAKFVEHLASLVTLCEDICKDPEPPKPVVAERYAIRVADRSNRTHYYLRGAFAGQEYWTKDATDPFILVSSKEGAEAAIVELDSLNRAEMVKRDLVIRPTNYSEFIPASGSFYIELTNPKESNQKQPPEPDCKFCDGGHTYAG